MKSEINLEFIKETKYPYIGILNTGRLVVLFSGSGRGTVVYVDDTKHEVKLGQYDSNWDENKFNKLVGTVQLSN